MRECIWVSNAGDARFSTQVCMVDLRQIASFLFCIAMNACPESEALEESWCRAAKLNLAIAQPLPKSLTLIQSRTLIPSLHKCTNIRRTNLISVINTVGKIAMWVDAACIGKLWLEPSNNGFWESLKTTPASLYWWPLLKVAPQHWYKCAIFLPLGSSVSWE